MRENLILHVMGFLNGELDSDTLVDWVAAHYQDIRDTGDAKAIDLADVIEGAFVQLGEEVLTLHQVWEDIEGQIRRMNTVEIGATPSTGTETSTLTTRETTPTVGSWIIVRTATESDLLIPAS